MSAGSQVRFGVSKGGFAVYPVHDAPLDSNGHLSEDAQKHFLHILRITPVHDNNYRGCPTSNTPSVAPTAVSANSVYTLQTMHVVLHDFNDCLAGNLL